MPPRSIWAIAGTIAVLAAQTVTYAVTPPAQPWVVQHIGEAEVPAAFMGSSRTGALQPGLEDAAAMRGNLDVAIIVDYSRGRPPFLSHQSLWKLMATNLGSTGHNVTVLFAAVEGVDGVEQAAANAQAELQGLRVKVKTLAKHKLRYSAPTHVAVSYDVYLWLASAKIQVAYFTDWQGLAYFSAVAKRQGLALNETLLVTLMTGPRVWQAMQVGGSALSTTADVEIAFMESAATERSDVVVAPDQGMVTWLGARGWKFPPTVLSVGFFPVSKIHSLPPPPGQTVSQRFNDSKETVVEFVYIGELTVRGGLPLFCSAILGLLKAEGNTLPFKVTVIGPKDQPMFRPRIVDKEVTGRTFVEEHEVQWRDARSPSPLQAPVSFLEELDTPRMLAYMSVPGKNRIAVLPSPSESGGWIMAELLHQGVPLLATNTSLSRLMVASEGQGRVLVTPIARRLASALSEALVALPRARPSDALAGAAAAWDTWHRRLSQAKAMAEGVSDGPRREGAAGLFPAGVEVLTSSFDSPASVLSEASSGSTKLEPPEGGWPPVSVVLVTYNRKELLIHALNSLRAQDYPSDKLGVVLVDDGSHAADALEFLDSLESEGHWFSQRQWKVVRSPGGYLGNARNRGLEAAEGEWVMFMDDDNFAKPHEVSTFIRAAARSGGEVLTCFNDYLPDGASAPDSKTVPSGRYVPLGPSSTASVFRNSIGDANAMFKRHVLVDLGGWAEDDAYAVQDWELLSAAVLKGYKVEVVPEALYWYRTNSGSMIRNKIYAVTKSLPLRSFLAHGSPSISPAIAVAAQQAEDVSLLRTKVSQLEESVSSQAQLLRLMSKESCQGGVGSQPPPGNRLRQSEFELWTSNGMAEEWGNYESGYSPSLESRPLAFQVPGNQGYHSINVTLTNIGQAGGAVQHIMIGQSTPRPLLLQGWSRVMQLVGGSGSPADYAIYADITYQDGSHRWAFHLPMDPEGDGWQHKWAVIDAPKPIHIISVVTMFRWYEGTVVFDDLLLTDISQGMCHIPISD